MMDRVPGESGDRFQVRLADLVVLVVGAAYVLDVARRSRLAWGGGLPDLEHAIGLTVLALGVSVGLVVVGQWVRRLRVGRGQTRAWPLIWRVAAAAWLAGSMVEVASALQADVIKNAVPPSLRDKDALRLRLGSLSAMLGMVGLFLASAPIAPGRRGAHPGPKPRLGSWPNVALASVVGLVILALEHGIIPYLVLIAMEAVWNAMRRAPLVHRPIVFDRLILASLQSLPGLVGCFLTAVWVDDDLRAADRDPVGARAPRPWWGVIARISTVLLAAGGSAYALFRSIPMLSVWLAEGLGTVVEPSMAATVVLGFAFLAGGFAARGAGLLAVAAEGDDPSASREARPRRLGAWPRRIIAVMVGLVMLEITGAAIQAMTRDLELRWYIPISLDSWALIFREPARWLGLPPSVFGWSPLFDRPDEFLIGIAALWMIARLVTLVYSKRPGPSALDAIAADRLAFGRFLGWWVALSTAMLASLPGLALVSVALTHYVVFWLAR